MDVRKCATLIAGVEMMGGDRLSDLLAPSEIMAIARAIVAAWPAEGNLQDPLARNLDFLISDRTMPIGRSAPPLP